MNGKPIILEDKKISAKHERPTMKRNKKEGKDMCLVDREVWIAARIIEYGGGSKELSSFTTLAEERKEGSAR